MPTTSEARIEANRRNALKSSGPKTAEGKEQSRRNGLKHGLSGKGIVVVDHDSAEVERRAETLMAELAPKSTIGRAMVGQLALLSVRMERGGRQEEAACSSRVRHASEAFDQERVDRAEEWFASLADDPRKILRQLRRSPEGVEILLEAWGELREVLTHSDKPTWTEARRGMVANLSGLGLDRAQGTRLDSLSQALRGEAILLADAEWVRLDAEGRQVWARDRLVEAVDARVAELEGHYESFDFEMIELDRIEAPGRALFDGSKGATLARRYESEARRGYYKALDEFRRAEAEAAEHAASKPAQATERSSSGWVRLGPRRRLPLASPSRPLARGSTGRVSPVTGPPEVWMGGSSPSAGPSWCPVERGRDDSQGEAGSWCAPGRRLSRIRADRGIVGQVICSDERAEPTNQGHLIHLSPLLDEPSGVG